MRQLLAAPFAPARRGRSSRPAPRRGRPPSSPARVVTAPSLNARAVAVADPVERGDDLVGEVAGLAEHGFDHVVGEIAEEALGAARPKPGGVLEREGDVGDRRLVGHASRLRAADAAVPMRASNAAAPARCRWRRCKRDGRRVTPSSG